MQRAESLPNAFVRPVRGDLLAVYGMAALLTVLMSIVSLAQLRSMGRADSIGHVVLVVMPDWLIWAALAPVVFQVTRWLGATLASTMPRAAAHTLVAFGLMLAYSAALYGWQRGFALTDLDIPLWKGALAVARWHLSTNILVYGALVSVARSRPGAPLVTRQPTDTTGAVPATTIVVKTAGRTSFVAVETIDWIEAADYCVRLHARGRTYTIRESMSSLESRLDARTFFRIHRSAIVNLDRVREVQPSQRGEHIVLLGDGTKVRLTRSRRSRLESALGSKR